MAFLRLGSTRRVVGFLLGAAAILAPSLVAAYVVFLRRDVAGG